MHRAHGLLVLLPLLLPLLAAHGTPGAAQDRIALAERLYENQQDSAALAEVRRARLEDPASLQARWREAFILLAVANRTPGSEARRSLLRQALPKADSLTRLHPDASEAWFVAALALGVESTVASPRRRVSLAKEMRQRIGRSLILDTRNAGAWYLLGKWHESLASLGPMERGLADLLLGGMPKGVSLDSARISLEEAAGLRPADLQIHRDLMQVLIVQGRKEAAKGIGRRALGFPIASAGDRDNRKAIEGLLRQL